LQNICAAITALAARYRSEVQIVFSVHLNPHIRGPVHQALSGHANLVMTEPMDYVAFVHLMKRATLIITDSGGIQEEAPVLGVPVLVIREVTERPEGVAAGAAQIIGTSAKDIVSAACQLLDDETVRSAMANNRWVYGDGHASKRILRALREFERGRAATSSVAAVGQS
jgi:UDP-N-acetylglucosamine 2-epimerase (non-hydrolysing)